ncbi:uncharacterized protein LOC122749041 isoform X2 [Dromiciops gliroides]|uniref:uncharacterized protein LOC122749041 isoform X2 n=1 Tax=Dromiciops gliroides TaxID=33562 RepID=UPI001CC40F7E|nr:uncharacterized protein LOC122749041 isoform X2 [Dromiciops gliroides]
MTKVTPAHHLTCVPPMVPSGLRLQQARLSRRSGRLLRITSPRLAGMSHPRPGAGGRTNGDVSPGAGQGSGGRRAGGPSPPYFPDSSDTAAAAATRPRRTPVPLAGSQSLALACWSSPPRGCAHLSPPGHLNPSLQSSSRGKRRLRAAPLFGRQCRRSWQGRRRCRAPADPSPPSLSLPARALRSPREAAAMVAAAVRGSHPARSQVDTAGGLERSSVWRARYDKMTPSRRSCRRSSTGFTSGFFFSCAFTHAT